MVSIQARKLAGSSGVCFVIVSTAGLPAQAGRRHGTATGYIYSSIQDP